MFCFFLTQVTGNYSLPIMFSNSQKNVPPPSIDRFTIPTIDLLSPKKERKKENKKKKKKKRKTPSNHNSAAITAAKPTTPPTTGTAPRPAAL